MKLIRCGSMIGDRALELSFYQFLNLRSKGYRLYCLESHTFAEVMHSLLGLRIFQPKERSADKGYRVVFRSSSLHLAKSFYKASWGDYWLLAFLVFQSCSWFAAAFIRTVWVFASITNLRFGSRFLLSNVVGPLISSRNSPDIFNCEFARYFESNSPVQSFDFDLFNDGLANSRSNSRKLSLSFDARVDLSLESLKSPSEYIQDSEKVVTILFRTGHYLNDYNNHRCSELEPYLSTARELRSLGYYPVFCGSYDKDTIHLMNKDAAHISSLNFRSPSYDEVCLIRDSCLFIHNATGPEYLTSLFGVNTLSVDTFPFVFDWETVNSRYLFKYFYSERLSRYLSLNEILELTDSLITAAYGRVNLSQSDAAGGEPAVDKFLFDNEIQIFQVSSRHLLSAAIDALGLSAPYSRTQLSAIQKLGIRHKSNALQSLEKLTLNSGKSHFSYIFKALECEGLPAEVMAMRPNSPWQP